jgi:hypothetical protein
VEVSFTFNSVYGPHHSSTKNIFGLSRQEKKSSIKIVGTLKHIITASSRLFKINHHTKCTPTSMLHNLNIVK